MPAGMWLQIAHEKTFSSRQVSNSSLASGNWRHLEIRGPLSSYSLRHPNPGTCPLRPLSLGGGGCGDHRMNLCGAVRPTGRARGQKDSKLPARVGALPTSLLQMPLSRFEEEPINTQSCTVSIFPKLNEGFTDLKFTSGFNAILSSLTS